MDDFLFLLGTSLDLLTLWWQSFTDLGYLPSIILCCIDSLGVSCLSFGALSLDLLVLSILYRAGIDTLIDLRYVAICDRASPIGTHPIRTHRRLLLPEIARAFTWNLLIHQRCSARLTSRSVVVLGRIPCLTVASFLQGPHAVHLLSRSILLVRHGL